MAAEPISYKPEYEREEKGERETIDKLIATMRQIQETTYEHGGHGMRGVHVKSHAVLRGTLRVVERLSPHLKQGLFAKPGSYEFIGRISTAPGDVLPDAVSVPRGFALKLVGVDGPRLPGSEGDVTQDFVLVSGGPAFHKPDAKGFLNGLKPLAAMTDKGTGVKEVVSKIARTVEKGIEAVGGESPTLKLMGGSRPEHPLGHPFFSQTPYLFGEYMAKLRLVPVSSELLALADTEVPIDEDDLALRNSLQNFFANSGGEWELQVQLATDPETMPLEDASVEWPEDESPYVTVARVSIPAQTAWTEEKASAVDDGMTYSPWHGIEPHRPLGSINRVRKNVYEMSKAFRAQRVGRAVTEPRSPADLPA